MDPRIFSRGESYDDSGWGVGGGGGVGQGDKSDFEAFIIGAALPFFGLGILFEELGRRKRSKGSKKSWRSSGRDKDY